ncbi:MAG: gamma-glutamylcyclotransferase [Proteobacteria bacterium]|nr:gamma-glutamylcyclotransferase [Pseudomonadota bacterium]
MNLFAYGTLMCADIMLQVAGCLPAQLPVALAHYRRCRVRGEEYPAIVGQQDAAVQGLVYLDVPQEAWQRLDGFEGEMYDRRPVLVDGVEGKSLAAHTYVIRPEFAHLLLPSEWSYEEFLRTGRKRFAADYGGFAALAEGQEGWGR